jgi:hypothetical protein
VQVPIETIQFRFIAPDGTLPKKQPVEFQAPVHKGKRTCAAVQHVRIADGFDHLFAM